MKQTSASQPRAARFARGADETLDRRNEAVPAAGKRLDEPWSVGDIAQGRPQPLDRGIQAVLEINESVARLGCVRHHETRRRDVVTGSEA